MLVGSVRKTVTQLRECTQKEAGNTERGSKNGASTSEREGGRKERVEHCQEV